MKLVKMILTVTVLAIVGGILYLGVADVSVPQKTVTEDVTPPAQ